MALEVMTMGTAAVVVVSLAAGGVELYLLSLFVKAVLSVSTGRAALLLSVKLLVLALALGITIVIRSELLWLAGCCIAVMLILGSGVMAFRHRKGGADNR